MKIICAQWKAMLNWLNGDSCMVCRSAVTFSGDKHCVTCRMKRIEQERERMKDPTP